MVGETSNGKIRQTSSIVNGNSDSDLGCNGTTECSSVEFTREEVEALLNEKMKVKNKFQYKERCEQMMEYIKKLRLCIKWYREQEGGYLMEQERIQSMLEHAERKFINTELFMISKEKELNSIIMELKMNYMSAQEKLVMEEADKLAAMDVVKIEKESRVVAEKMCSSLSEELEKAHREQQYSKQKILSMNDMYKRLQEYNTSLQQYNSKLQTELAALNETLKLLEKEKTAAVENLGTLRSYQDVLQNQLATSQDMHMETTKQKEALETEVGRLRTELEQMKNERDSQLSRIKALMDEVVQFKECTGKSSVELDTLTLKANNLEAKCSSQHDHIRTLQEKLSNAEEKLRASDLSTLEMKEAFEQQKKHILVLQDRLADAELKIIDGEKIRKTMHNTILELKGNIRVFCRVRPLLPEDGVGVESKIISYPTSTEALGRGIDLVQNGQRHCFIFDKVFIPEASQDEVFVEISQLVQSALDGYKVCIFAYGQTGSGKTYTMMGTPGIPELKGLIPRSLEQIFGSTQSLQSQGWKYEMQVSMLEIYNETIRDLLSTKSSSDALRQYVIKHDSSGNTFVPDLNIIDVRSTEEISFLLERAQQSRSVGRTQINEQSSRSHLVFTLRISGINENTGEDVQGVLNLIDLAGSERLSKSGSTGERLKETQAINKSLSSLCDVIFALAKKEDHVPFRNSKLTFLLQPCLGGNSKTLMFVNVSPDPSSLGESLCALRFASRVNACEIGVPRRQAHLRTPEHRFSYG